MTPPSSTAQGTTGLIHRSLPEFADRFILQSLSAPEHGDAFEISSADGAIILRGSSERARSAAFGWYLRYVCHCDLSWDRGNIVLDSLPDVPQAIRRTTSINHHYYLNYVTFSYSTAFWDWARWKREIDWMALHGITMPLAINGLERVWRNVFSRLGIPVERLDASVVGPAFQPFGWLGVMDSWGGPSPAGWMDSQASLQQRILERQRSLGMTPVLHGFLGHVPPVLAETFPDSHFLHPKLSSFPPTTIIDPADPLFIEIGNLFIEEQIRLYGTDHLYATDLFWATGNADVPVGDAADLGRSLLRATTVTDPEARLVMQSWPFQTNPEYWTPERFEAFLAAIPDDRVILLDLWAEQKPMWTTTSAFHGKPWMWCLLHNFGGRQGMHGNLAAIGAGLGTILQNPDAGHLAGAGITAEATEQNAIVYELFNDSIWSAHPVDPAEWLPGAIHRRYGVEDPNAVLAWNLLYQTVHARNDPYMTNRHRVICQRPSVDILLHHSFDLHVPATEVDALAGALRHLLRVKADPHCQRAYRRDLVDIGHQLVATRAMEWFRGMSDAFRNGDHAAFRQLAEQFTGALDDLDRLAATHESFLLGRWIESARKWGTTDTDRDPLERNARLLVTLWSWAGSTLNDYSGRFWAGLLKDFHARRWKLFLDAWQEGKDSSAITHALHEWEEHWVRETINPGTSPVGDTNTIANELLQVYA